MFSSLTVTSAFSETGGAAPARVHVCPLSVDTSSITGHDGPAIGLMGHVPTTAHPPGPIALTSDTTGPSPARPQVLPPSDVTHSATVPVADGGPPHRYPWAVSENSNWAGKLT